MKNMRTPPEKVTSLAILLIIALLIVPGAAAATINATSCAQTDVQAAVNSAHENDTVAVPPGSCSWTTTTAYTASVRVDKAITLSGAGIDQTIINDETGSLAGENALSIGDNVRVTGFTFTDMKRPDATGTAEPAIGAEGSGWRIDHNKLYPNNANPGRGISTGGIGLVDHNTFIDCKQGIEVWGDGDASWTSEPQALGSANAIYVEDNVFSYGADPLDGALDAYDGARYVFRYNTLNNTNIGHHGLDSGGLRSTHSWEIYGNRFNNAMTHIWVAFGSRGGSGVVFNNIVTGAYDSFGLLENYRSDDSYACSWGTCNGTNPLDGNTPGGQGYPCRDQNGRTTNQALSPVYQWNNSFKGSPGFFWVKGYDDSSNRAMVYHILANRDYFDNLQKPGYTPFTYPYPLNARGLPDPNGTDTSPPTTPTGLGATAISSSRISLSWSASTDNVGVAGYRVYRNATMAGTSTTTLYNDTGLLPATTYSYTVIAFDAAGHNSSLSLPAIATTQAAYSSPRTYTTNFSLTENPISESGNWTNGKTSGLDWADVRTTSGLAYGTSLPSQYADPTAVLAGAWGPNQTAQATIRVTTPPASCCHEVELRLRTTIAAHSITGYEILCSVVNSDQYLQIVRWNGPLNDFTYVNTLSTSCANGDVLKATMNGSIITVYKNGVQILQGTDSTFMSGNPGIGFYDNSDSNWNTFGFSSFTATDGTMNDLTPPIISAISASQITSNNATISWTTDDLSDSQVEYGTTAGYGQATTLNASMTTSHSVRITGLAVSTIHHYRVKSRNSAGNLTTSGDYNFTTSGSAQNSTAINAASCSQADVQTALNSAQSGDTVTIPAGNCIWSSDISISKGIRLQGAGAGGILGRSTTSNAIGTGLKTFTTQSGLNLQAGETITVMYLANGAIRMTGTVTSYIGTTLVLTINSFNGSGIYNFWLFARPAQTTLVNNYAINEATMFALTESTASSIEISGIHFVGGTISGNAGKHIIISPTTGGKPVLIHDNWFSATGNVGGSIRTTSNKGIVYKNSFDNGLCSSTALGCTLSVSQAVSLKAPTRTDAWVSPSYMGMNDIGGVNNFYIEDNYFAGFWQSDMDFDDNSRSVTRHNIFDNSAMGSHGADTSNVGVRYYEIYDNNYIFSDMGDYTYNLNWWFFFRGGTGIITDNILPNITSQAYGDKSEIVLTVMNLQRNSGPNPCWGANITGIQYPTPRQVGMGRVTGTAGTDSITYVGDSEPMYIWNNTGTYSIGINDYGGTECTNPDSTTVYIVAGRDYFLNTAKPGYLKYTYPHPLTFTGTNWTNSTPSNLTGDVNGDRQVNLIDLTLVAANIGKTNPYDLNSDGTINLYDIMIIVKNWGRTA
jgi:hypothetical protein